MFFIVFVLRKVVFFATFCMFFVTRLAKHDPHFAPFSQNQPAKKRKKHQSNVSSKEKLSDFLKKCDSKSIFRTPFCVRFAKRKQNVDFKGTVLLASYLIGAFYNSFGTCELRCFFSANKCA